MTGPLGEGSHDTMCTQIGTLVRPSSLDSVMSSIFLALPLLKLSHV